MASSRSRDARPQSEWPYALRVVLDDRTHVVLDDQARVVLDD